jgi:NADH-quinone oxidoreductase subunit C
MGMTETIKEKIVNAIDEHFNKAVQKQEMLYDMFTITLRKDAVIPAIQWLYDNEELKFKFLTTMCALHYPDQKDELGMMYQLHSLENNLRIRIKTFFPKDQAVMPTLTGIYSAANWMERQEYDFFGVDFKGHPNLKRILNVDDMIIHPMRKEFPLEDQTRKDKNDNMFGR